VNTYASRAAAPLRPDLLRVLRVLAGVRLGLAVLFAVVTTMMLGYLMPLLLLPLLTASAVLMFVLSGRLEERLGAWHLKLAIVIMTADVLLITGYYTQWLLLHLFPPAMRASILPPVEFWFQSMGFALVQTAPPFLPMVVLVNLFVLLIVVSWELKLRHAIGYVAVTSLIDVCIVLAVFSGSLQTLMLMAFIFARTIIFCILAGVISYLVNIQNKQQRSLMEANAELTRYVTVIEELTISRERNRLARELHDTLAHTLSAASVQLEAADSLWQNDNVRSHTALTQAMTITRDGLAETRRALKALRASPLDDLGLVLALKELGELTRQRSGAQVSVSTPAQLAPLPAEVEQTLYRAAQEALENVVRHARATHVDLTLRQNGDTISMIVQDDGVGFDPDSAQAQHERFGLNGMLERVAVLGGRMKINSAPNAGTRITLEITIHDHSRLAV
jgi:signal transduction histidine kinase